MASNSNQSRSVSKTTSTRKTSAPTRTAPSKAPSRTTGAAASRCASGNCSPSASKSTAASTPARNSASTSPSTSASPSASSAQSSSRSSAPSRGQAGNPRDGVALSSADKVQGSGKVEHLSTLMDNFRPALDTAQKALEPMAPEEVKRYGDLIKMGTQVPGLMDATRDIQKNGFTADNVARLKAAEGDLKNVITPENIDFLRKLDGKQLENLFSKDNLERLKQVAPEMAEKLDGEKVKQLTGGLKQMQGISKDDINGAMNKMAPWVNTMDPKGNVREGYLNMVDRMLGDPTKLGGNDRNLSKEDLREVIAGGLRTCEGQRQLDHAIRSDSRVNFNRRGRERLPFVKEAIVNVVKNKATPDRIASMAKDRIGDQLGSTGRSDNVRRNFSEHEMRSLVDAGQRANQMMGQMRSGNLSPQEQQMADFQQGIVAPLKKSINTSDGISQQEVHNLTEVANMGYRLLDQLRVAW